MRERNYWSELLSACLIVSLTLLQVGCGGSKGGRSHTGQAPNTDTTPPTVSSTSPANGDTQIPINALIRAVFSEPINPDTLTSNTFIVLAVGTSGGVTVPGTVTYTAETMTATFTPTTPTSLLEIDKTYTMTITTGVEDEAGNTMAEPFSWSFTTGAAIDNTPPSFSGNDPQLVAQATSSNSISLEWVAASDNTTPPNQLIYVVCRSTVSTDCTVNPFPATGGNVVITETAAGKLTLGVTGLSSSTTYYFVVRAKDQVNLMDSNIAQKSATTLGDFVSLGGSLNHNCTGSGDLKLCDQDAANPSIAFVGGVPYVAWSEGGVSQTVYLRTFNESSGEWSSASTVSSNSSYPQIVSNNASSALYITFTQTDSGTGKRNIHVRKLNGSTWDPVGTNPLNMLSTNDASNSVIAFDSTGNLHIAWSEKTGGINQIYVKRFIEGQDWQTMGTSNSGSLNVNTGQYAFNPSIAINGNTIKVAWTECNDANKNNCQLYVKTWNSSSGDWDPATPPSLRDTFSGLNVRLENTSITFINGETYLAWPESSKVFVRKDTGSGFGAAETISSSAQSSSNTQVKGTATSTQVPYIVYADTVNPINVNPPMNPPFLFVKRWNGTAWVTEGSGPLNMTGGTANASMNSYIAFSGGTAYVAWTEKGSCRTVGADPNPCNQSDTTHYQLYVKRLQ